MGPLPLILALLAMASVCASLLLLRAAWPKFKAMERRGEIRKPIPTESIGAGSSNYRVFGLLWLTPIPADRPQLKRLVIAYRFANLAGLSLIVATMAAMFAPGGVRSDATPRPDGRPTVTIPIFAQDH